MSYKPYFEIDGKKCFNAQAFETESEALESAQARFMVWTPLIKKHYNRNFSMPTGYGAIESGEKVNYRRIGGQDEMV